MRRRPFRRSRRPPPARRRARARRPTRRPTVGSGDVATAADCETDNLPLYQDGQLTIATDNPAFPPWFVDNDPTNGKGYESAVAYALAEQMGFTDDQVEWVKVRFNNSYKPGAKEFDFDINQVSITPARAKVVTSPTGTTRRPRRSSRSRAARPPRRPASTTSRPCSSAPRPAPRR